jgi:hypothetical protein
MTQTDRNKQQRGPDKRPEAQGKGAGRAPEQQHRDRPSDEPDDRGQGVHREDGHIGQQQREGGHGQG